MNLNVSLIINHLLNPWRRRQPWKCSRDRLSWMVWNTLPYIYIHYVGDGDSSSFKVVSKALHELLGENYTILKEDCIGHIQKRMGSNLRTFKKSGKKLDDGLGIGGRGRLTDAFIDKLQNNYGAAIRNNSGDLQGIQNIYYHSIRVEEGSHAKQRHYCPTGSSSWCNYQKDITHST